MARLLRSRRWITFLITGRETSGAFFMAEVIFAPGRGPPPHVHSREDESLYVQRGQLAAQVGGKTLNGSAPVFRNACAMPRGM